LISKVGDPSGCESRLVGRRVCTSLHPIFRAFGMTGGTPCDGFCGSYDVFNPL